VICGVVGIQTEGETDSTEFADLGGLVVSHLNFQARRAANENETA